MAGRAASRPIAMAGRGIVEVEVQWARWARAFTQAVPSPWGNEGRQCKPKSLHILYVVEDIHELVHAAEQDNARTTGTTCERRQTRGYWNAHKGQDTTYLYPANTGEVGSLVKGFRGCV